MAANEMYEWSGWAQGVTGHGVWRPLSVLIKGVGKAMGRPERSANVQLDDERYATPSLRLHSNKREREPPPIGLGFTQ